MESNNGSHRGQGGFPADRPIDALKADHRLVRQLFDQFFNTQDVNAKKEGGPRLLLLLEMHAALEESVFYPRVQEAEPGLVEHCEQEHQEARQLIEQLKGMDEADAQYEQLMRQLSESVMRHVENEEQTLFPKVQQSGLDLGEIGLQMQAFESNMLGTQARQSGQRGMQQ
ncbi:MAG TPA: hemerythrin domain-containing protein [Noviherbaspirillum sp.]|uniref:hemerythrin domain-containing protein n=1 Tax=Noviherbaspirillum sp. TaxID=1926288 RepID=UPI002D560CE5|nr:hemerythrin domain-containing protein [Noviherbaspirillum sp.]HYD95000.1 hemerythrin domain-containing protein [Noviherbaspirillum sp.]